MSRRLPRITSKEALRALSRAGFTLHHQRGSHAQLRHEAKGLYVTIPIHAREILLPKTLKSIIKQAGLSVEDFAKLLRG